MWFLQKLNPPTIPFFLNFPLTTQNLILNLYTLPPYLKTLICHLVIPQNFPPFFHFNLTFGLWSICIFIGIIIHSFYNCFFWIKHHGFKGFLMFMINMELRFPWDPNLGNPMIHWLMMTILLNSKQWNPNSCPIAPMDHVGYILVLDLIRDCKYHYGKPWEIHLIY